MGSINGRSPVAGRRFGLVSATALTLVLVVGGNSTFAAAPAPVLKWKFKAGETLHYSMEQKTTTEAKVNNQNIKTNVLQTIDTTWTVKSVDASGSAEMTQMIDRLRTKIESPFATVEYDSKDGKVPEGQIAAGIIPMLKALVGSVFTYKINAQGELSDVHLPEGLVKTLKEANSGGGGAQMFTEEGLKNMIHESSLIFPAQGLEKPWTRLSTIPSPPIGTMKLEKIYKYEGAEGKNEKIGLVIKIGFEPDPASNVKVQLSAIDGKGTFLFDNESGRVVNSNVSQKVEMTVNVMNMEVVQSTETASAMKLTSTEEAKK